MLDPFISGLIIAGLSSWLISKLGDLFLMIFKAILTNKKVREALWKMYRRLFFSKYNKFGRRK